MQKCRCIQPSAAYHAIGHHIPHLGWLQICDNHHSAILHLLYGYKLDQAAHNLHHIALVDTTLVACQSDTAQLYENCKKASGLDFARLAVMLV